MNTLELGTSFCPGTVCIGPHVTHSCGFFTRAKSMWVKGFHGMPGFDATSRLVTETESALAKYDILTFRPTPDQLLFGLYG